MSTNTQPAKETEAKLPPLGVSLSSLTKPEAARLVAGALAHSGWLPGPLLVQPPALALAA